MLPVSSKIWLINISLAAVVVFMGIMSVDIWTKPYEMPLIRSDNKPDKPVSEKRIIERVVPPPSNYEIVATNSLFSPDRAESIVETAAPATGNISEKKIFLYGIMTLGSRKKALISSPDPDNPSANGPPKDKWVAVGDTVENFKVTEIGKDRIVIRDGADRYEILLYDKNKPVANQAPARQSSTAPTVIVTGKQPASSGSGTAPASASGPATETSDSEGKYKIIDTPFGPVKRRIK